MTTQPTIVLVHGALTDASIWHGVIARQKTRGYTALTPGVRALMYVAAFQPDQGETTGELNAKFPGGRLGPETTVARPGAGGADLYLRPEDFADVYAADVDPRTAAVMAAAQRPIDPAALGEALTGPAAGHTLPSWALVSTADNSLPAEAQRFMAERGGSTTTEIKAAHAVPVSHPEETAALIATAAGVRS